jgi:hypothetical protein
MEIAPEINCKIETLLMILNLQRKALMEKYSSSIKPFFDRKS